MLLPPFVSTALLQLLHIGLIVSFGFACSFASYPKYFQIALQLCSLSTKAGCRGAALTIFIFTSLLLFNQSEWDETRDRHCGHVWCLSTRLWREVKVTARLGSEYRYFGKLVLVPFRYFSIDIYRNIDIFDNTNRFSTQQNGMTNSFILNLAFIAFWKRALHIYLQLYSPDCIRLKEGSHIHQRWYTGE